MFALETLVNSVDRYQLLARTYEPYRFKFQTGGSQQTQ